MHPDILARLDNTEPAQLFDYLKVCLQEDDAICGPMFNPSRRDEFFRIVAKAVGFDPHHPPRGYEAA